MCSQLMYFLSLYTEFSTQTSMVEVKKYLHDNETGDVCKDDVVVWWRRQADTE